MVLHLAEVALFGGQHGVNLSQGWKRVTMVRDILQLLFSCFVYLRLSPECDYLKCIQIQVIKD